MADTNEPLTSSEEALLALVRDRMVDAEIAVRLGLGIGEVQRRVEFLARKLGVADRAALRDVRGDVHVGGRPESRQEEGASVTPRRSSQRARILTRFAPLAGVSLLGVAVLALILQMHGGAQPSSTPDATLPPGASSVSPGVEAAEAATTPPPLLLGGERARSVTVGADDGSGRFDLFDTSFLITTQCRACSGSDVHLMRVTRPAGLPSAPYLETITVPSVGEPSTALAVVSDRWGWRVALTVCVDVSPGDCSSFDGPNGLSALLLSQDGGVTWQEVGRYSGTMVPLFIGREGILTFRRYRAGEGPEFSAAYWFVTPHDSGVEMPARETFRPIGLLPDGSTAWADDGLDGRSGYGAWVVYDSQGEVALRVPVSGRFLSLLSLTDNSVVVVLDTGGDSFKAVVVTTDDKVDPITAAFDRFPFLQAVPFVSRQTGPYLISADQFGVDPARRFLPALDHPGPWTPVGILSALSGELYELRRFFAFDEFNLMAITVKGAREGPHIRVVAPRSGNCAPVYERPDPQSPVAACFAAGVLLWDAGYDPATLLRHDMLQGSNVWVPVAWPGAPAALTRFEGWMLAPNLRPELAGVPQDNR